jgi:hypothetical protein
MKFKISILVFIFVFKSVLFSQKNQNEKTIDSIIVEVTRNYASINTDVKIQEASQNCYKEFVNNRDTTKPFLENYGELLQRHNLSKIKTDLFLSLIKIKQKVPNLQLNDFLVSLQVFSQNFPLKNYDKEKIFMTNELFDKYKSRIPENIEKPSEERVQENKYEIYSFQNLLIGVLVILLFFFLYRNYQLRKSIKEKKRNSNQSHQKISFSNVNKENEINHLKNRINQLEKELQKLNSCHPESSITSNNEINNSNENDKINDTQSNSVFVTSTFYFRQPSSDGNFKNELKIDDFEPSLSMFKFTKTSDLKSTFEYCGDSSISKLISNNPNTHLGLVSDFVNSSDQYNSRIENVASGNAELKNDLWIVTQKAKIKFS